MKNILVAHATIFILLFPITLSFGQQTIPEEAIRHRDRGITAVEMAKSVEDYEAAIKEFEQVVRLAPGWPDAYYNLGMVQGTADKYGDAITNLKEYLRLAPKATDAETVKGLINKLEYKKENALSVSEVIDVILSYGNDAKLPLANRKWKESSYRSATNWLDFVGWGITREGDDSVRVRKSLVFPFVFSPEGYQVQTGEPVEYYQTVKVDGRILRFRFTFVNWGTPTELEIELEVVSKTLIRVTEKVTRPGPWNKEWREGQSVSGELRKAKDAGINAKDASINAKDSAGRTPLHNAIIGDTIENSMLQSKEAVELLIAKGADVNARDKNQQTPLHYAAFYGCKKDAELLIAKGADINTKDQFGGTPLHDAALEGQKEVVELLIAKGADINAKDEFGKTPLHVAANEGHRDVAEVLIAKGADINAKDQFGKTPLQYAYAESNNLKDYKDVADLLKKHGAR